ncbi:hypothetical protein [Paraburkholderia domus]|uniref:hypothetical protein n=1 Tax=Paraburkholderia domus TaxID=2793075 RepID=UPI001EEFDBF9|nr:hypothetical protein [Paraburkholderia domus]
MPRDKENIMTKKTIIVDEFHQGTSAQTYRDGVQQMRDAVSEIHKKNDGIAAVRALDGRIFATLSDDEMAVLNFYRDTGRKFGVAVSIINEADPDELARASSREQADQILKRANSRVSVTVSQR